MHVSILIKTVFKQMRENEQIAQKEDLQIIYLNAAP